MGWKSTAVVLLTLSGATGCAGREIAPGECTLTIEHTQAVRGLGAAQGVFINHGFVYFFGDTEKNQLLEFLVDARDELIPTGRRVRLVVDDGEALQHPQGLTSVEGVGTFLGDTIGRRGAIYRLDWPSALDTGNMATAVLHRVLDEEERYGPHPELVHVKGRWLIATATYHADEADNDIHLLDPNSFSPPARTFGDDDDVHAFSCGLACGTWIQSLHYDEKSDTLALVQNVDEHRGWRVTYMDLLASVEQGEARGVRRLEVDFDDELEGYGVLDDGRALFLSNNWTDSDTITIGRVMCPDAVD